VRPPDPPNALLLCRGERDGDDAHDRKIEREDDGRWIAEIVDLPGVVAYGASEAEARHKVTVLALRVRPIEAATPPPATPPDQVRSGAGSGTGSPKGGVRRGLRGMTMLPLGSI
jgi:hypothetical protein